MSKVSYERFKRGQIWKIFKDEAKSEKAMEDKDNHLQEKTRTWLIVSTDASNDNAPILNCVPMTSRLRDLPCHVRVTMDRCDCMIMCEHVMTVNKSDLVNAQFVGVLSEHYMRKVEIALANQLGLSVQIPSVEALERFIENLANAKAKQIKEQSLKVTDDFVLDLASKLEATFGVEPENVATYEPPMRSAEPKPSAQKGKKEDTKLKSPQSDKSKPREKKWTPEAMEAFLSDFDKFSSEEMQRRYGMSMKSLYTTRSRFRHLLNEGKQGQTG